MKTKLREIQKQRRFSESFKKELVHLFESGQYSVLQLEKLYSVDNTTIYNWIYKYSTFNEKGVRVIEMKDSLSVKLKALEDQVKALEQIVGQKQIKIDFLEKMVDIASEELKVDIKKNFNTPPSAGFVKTKVK
ncbi:MAG TPA: transposase [Chitinophagales bacterium]|nr:transposase [Chitinophagales bacterium]